MGSVAGPIRLARLGWTYQALETPRKRRRQKQIIEFEKAMEEGDTKCLVTMASKAELSRRRDAGVRVLMEETL